ncbi:MAG: TolB protein [Acidimicrobiaceae bacterium]|nr:TolB protein [Acidimicrobiaceae bacterium]
MAVAVALALTGSGLAGLVAVGDRHQPDPDGPTTLAAGDGPTTSTSTPTSPAPLGVVGPPSGSSAASSRHIGARPRSTTASPPLADSTTTTTTTTPPATPPVPVVADDPAPVAYPAGPADDLALGGVYVVGLGDGVPHRIAADAAVFDRSAWSADGHEVVYAIDNEAHDVFRVGADGRHRTPLPAGGIETPAWSAQGGLAFIAYDGVGYDLVLIPAAGGPTARITHEQVGAVSGRAWSPDGSRIALVADGRVWVADADGRGVQALTPAGGLAWRWVQWSPDGRRLAYYESEHVMIVGADGSSRHEVAPANGDPTFAWSPDSTQLAVGAPYSAKFDIGVVSADGGPVHSLGVQGIELSWSPDGSAIAYKQWPVQNGALALGLIAPDGTGARTLLSPPSGVYFGLGLAWSPDSSHLLVNTGTSGEGGPPEPM